jgi:hypothetical protein
LIAAMEKEQLRHKGFWNLALLHYVRKDVADLIDRNGDALIRGFVRPLIEEMHHEGILEDYSWMRYSEGGFHIRCQFRAASAEQGQQQLDLVRSRFELYKIQNRDLFDGVTELSEMALQLNRKSSNSELKCPGTLESGPAYDTGEESVYDHWQACAFSMRMQTRLARLCTKMIAMEQPYSRNLMVAVVCGFRILDALAVTRRGIAKHAGFICETWRTFFGVSAREDDANAAHIWRREQSISQLFDAMRDGEDGFGLIPQQLHREYRETLSLMASGEADALHTERPALSAMQVLSMFHQVFNRLGISIIDETACCDLMRKYASKELRAEELMEIDDAVSDWLAYWSVNRVQI